MAEVENISLYFSVREKRGERKDYGRDSSCAGPYFELNASCEAASSVRCSIPSQCLVSSGVCAVGRWDLYGKDEKLDILVSISLNLGFTKQAFPIVPNS
jgi:hypothetical protein